MSNTHISSVLLITKGESGEAPRLGKEIGEWFESKGIGYKLFSNSHLPDLEELDLFPNLILVLGGDGTLLFVIRKYFGYNIPFLGINFGRVGFLTDIEPEQWRKCLAEVLEGNASVCERLLLEYSVKRGGKKIRGGCAVNDLVVSRSHLARLITLCVEIGGEGHSCLRADGIIVSTPNGSTGYCTAAGGATVFPSLDVIELCPVSPFMSRTVPLILPSDILIRIWVEEPSGEAWFTIDGQEGFPLSIGDVVEINRSPNPLRFFIPPGSSYIKKLKLKGYI